MTAQQLAISICFVCALIGAYAIPARAVKERTPLNCVFWGFVGLYTGAMAGILLVTASACTYRIGLWAYLLIQK